MPLQIPDPVIGVWAKGFPASSHGLRLSEVAGAGLHLSDLVTPAFTVHEAALTHNETTVFDWAREQGVRLAPHGKTTMAPALWQRLLDAGSWGLSVATPWQAEVAIEAGVHTVLIANAVADAATARRLGELLGADDALRVLCWADSVETVRILAEGLADAMRPLDVLVELGGPGGRSGARTVAEGELIAEAVQAAPGLRLAGVTGYEGPFGKDRSAESIAAVDAYLQTLVELHTRLTYPDEIRPILSAGGSAFPDRAAAVLGAQRESADVVVRSGAFQIHDDGFYTRMSPFGPEIGTETLRSAMHLWARVVSQPEEGLALVDAGRRDAPFDIDLPMPQRADGAAFEGEVFKLNDQHGFVRIAPGSTAPVGSVLRLGLSHPCTAFDKWKVVAVIDDPDAADPRVIGAVATCF